MARRRRLAFARWRRCRPLTRTDRPATSPAIRSSEASTGPIRRRPAAGDRGALRGPQRGRALPDAARRDRHGQDRDDGLDHRAGPAPRARDRPQQDARRAALQRVPRVLPDERGRVLRLLLRLLPARGVRPAGRPLHREGLVPERRHRAAPARGDVGALHAPRRRRRRLGLVHLRPRLAGGVARARADPRRGGGARPRPRPAQADRQPVRPQRRRARPRALPRAGRRDRDAAGEPGERVPRLVLRRRGRADHALRPAHAARCSPSSTTSRSGRPPST